MPTPRRRPWGQLWSAAPWDGRAKPPEPLRIPNTDAALIDTPPPTGGAVRLRRRPFGRMLAAVPWSGTSHDRWRVALDLPAAAPDAADRPTPTSRQRTP